ncbi:MULTISPECIES: phosphotransferase [Auritidibacter]|uniref:phosphotransferase n=1 Tax=Auritidibacter TaxID=1160973 RepID=UPI000D733192|nr:MULTISPECIES: phosphotransferase [Auritidibacter]AXR73072.1 hypothetical protein DCC27_000735 [Auritidibacter sp. NML130574]PXA81826.1 hypothetical protein DCC25_00065 [Auritidibacter sp. NML120636]WGH81611.1 phosphotransferase [Auritidibacter ignavus]WGH83874.1 phosphotransferase [Auritidibacter ignavus]WGH86221.1 phosphotransferase [Auritidibacter ignavus]
MNSHDLIELLRDYCARKGFRLDRAAVIDTQRRGPELTWLIEGFVVDGGRESRRYWGITTEILPVGVAEMITADDGTELELWEHPADPLLPGLKLASTPSTVQQRFEHLGKLRSLRMVAYRPLRRAVLRADFHLGRGLDHSFFLKVLPEGEADQIYQKHLVCADAGVPVVLPVAEPSRDILVLDAGCGISLTELVNSGRGEAFSLCELRAVLEQLPDQLVDLPHRASWAERVSEFAVGAQHQFLGQAGRIEQLSTEIHRRLDATDPGPQVAVHGDLYEAHLLLDPTTGAIRSILDVDAAGPGHHIDDLACLIGHLAVSETSVTLHQRWRLVETYFDQLTHPNLMARTAPFRDPVDASGLGGRAAAVVLSLLSTLSEHDVQAAEQRLELAERLLEHS